MKVGADRVDITPPLPVDLLGYVRRPVSAHSVWDRLEARACYLSQGDVTVVIIAADVAGLTTAFSDRIRERVSVLVGCRPEQVLLNSSHSHAAPWPGAGLKMGGGVDGWTDTELAYLDYLPHAYASAAVAARDGAVEARISGGAGRVSGWRLTGVSELMKAKRS